MKKLLLLLFMFAGLGVFAQENFDSVTAPALPSGWTQFETGTGTVQSWQTTNSATFIYGTTGNSAIINRENVATGQAIDWLVSNQITVPANGQLRFQTKTIQTGIQGSLFDIKVSTTSQTNPAAFTNLISYDEASLTAVANVFEEKVIDISSIPAGTQVFIAFVMTNDNGDRWVIDNVNVVQKCNTPIGPLATSLETTNSTQLSWGNPGGITNWQVQVCPFSDTFGGASTITYNTTNNPFVATGLAANTLYKFQVRSVCTGSVGNYESDWFGPRSFQTSSLGDYCTGPIVVGALPYTTTDNTVNYLDTNDVAQPLACSGSATNYMAGNDVYYSFTPATTGNYVFSLAPTNNSSSIHIYTQCPSASMPASACLGGAANTNSGIRTITLNGLVGGTTYYVIISSSAAQQTVGYTLTIQQAFCNQPTGLTATGITTTTANLAWAAAAGTTSWQYSIGAAPYGLPVGAGTDTSSNTINPFTGTPGLVYQYYVRANCNDGNYSIWTGPFTFTLPQVPTPLNFTDGFETLTGWTLSSGTLTNKWAVGTGINNGGTHALYITDNNGTSNTYTNTATSVVHAYKDFVVPAGATQLDFTFDWRANGEAVNDNLRVWTVPATFGPITGTPITALANSRIKIGNDFLLNSNFTTENFTLNAAPYAGSTMRVVFEWRNNASLGNQPPAAIDNIILNLVPCPKPGNLVISNIGYNAAQVAWANGATETQWEILVLPAGSPAPTASSVGEITNTASPFLITGLNSVTCYDVYIRARCSATEFSFWSVPVNFCTTPNYCAGDHFYDTGGISGNYQNNENITSIICPNNVGDVVTIVFNSFNLAAGDNLVIRNGNLATSPILGTFTGATLPPSFTSTSTTGCLTFVFTSNGTVVSSGWDAVVYCTPPITCSKPSGVSISNITATSADISWTESGTATGWQVLVLPAGSNVPIFTATGSSFSSTTINFPGLLPSSSYTVYVRAICSSTNRSFWTDGVNFSTPPVNDECINAIQATVNSELQCVNTNLVDLKGATPSITSGTCNANANDIWYKFTATSTTHTIQMEGVTALMNSIDLAFYSGTCSALTLIQCGTTANVAGPTVVGNTIEGHVANGLTIGQTYYIRITTTLATPVSIPLKLCIGSVSCSSADPLCAGVTYANSTDVINFGSFGCLGSTPNVKFFFIQAGTTGTYTCNISQTSGDVDYALWGPFATKDIGCALVPMDEPTPATVPLNAYPNDPIRCSFSTAAVENFTLPVIAGEFYILMVTNFVNDPGTISIVTNQTIPTCYNADFNYSQPEYCKNHAPTSPIFVSGGSAGTFTAIPAGLSINSATGEINFVNSAPGNYVVTNTVIPNNLPPYSNDPITHSVLVTVTQPANATINFANNGVFCNSDPAIYPVILTGISGPNPIFTATPAGLQYALDPISGSITPSLALPGIYTVTMTIPANGGCSAYLTTKIVEILLSPNIEYKQDVNACNSYQLPVLTVGNYYTESGGPGGTGTLLNAGDIINTNQTIYIYATNGTCSSQLSFKVNIVSIPTPTFSYLTQPTCAVQTGSINITAPISISGTVPTNLFISEVTDANTGSLSYVELYNATGASVNLSGYKLRVYNNGGATPTCDNVLSGTIANNSTFIIRLSSVANIPGILPNLTLATCTGVNENDNIRLTTLANVVLDMWGPTDGSVFTPLGQPGYTYRRLGSASPLPSPTWNAAQWSTLDPENYSNLGQYLLNTSSYEYSVDGGPYQSNTTFTGILTGNHSFVVHDKINDCISAPIPFTINPVPFTNSVTGFSYNTPVCITNTTNPTPVLDAGFTTGGLFSYIETTSGNAVGLDLNPSNGLINLANSSAGVYTITYTYSTNLSNCINSGSSSFTITISGIITPIFTQIPSLCQNTTAPTLPLSSNNTPPITGTWNAAINTSTPGTTTYTFTPDLGQCAVSTTMDITVFAPNITPVFTQIPNICQNTTAPTLPLSSNNTPPITGTWNAAINTSTPGTTTYTFTPNPGQCALPTTMIVTVNSIVTPTFNAIAAICKNESAPALPTLSNNTIPIAGTWTPSVINTTNVGTSSYTFTPNAGQCAQIVTVSITIEPRVTPTFTQVEALCVGDASVTLPSISTNSVEGIWSPSFVNTSTESNLVYTFTPNSSECASSVTMTIQVEQCQIQKGISPNGDNRNDYLELVANKVEIFNRFGKEVYSKTNYNNDWHGQFMGGGDMPDGTYYYVIELVSGEKKTGWIYINREQ